MSFDPLDGVGTLYEYSLGGASISVRSSVAAVPEPSSWALLAIGGFIAMKRRRRCKQQS